jgi:hypothetical protein
MDSKIIDKIELEIPEGKRLKAFTINNIGRTTLLSYMSILELSQHSEVANDRNGRFSEDEISQRKLDPIHANSLALYFLKSLLDAAIKNLINEGKKVGDTFYHIQDQIGKKIYYTIPPIVANLREGSIDDIRKIFSEGREIICYEITLKLNDTLWIVDGQHRKRGIEILLDYLREVTANNKYPGKGSLFCEHKNRLTKEELDVWFECRKMCRICQIAVEIHFGLGIDEERQLFHDLNTYGKSVDQSLANKFDSSNPINNYVFQKLNILCWMLLVKQTGTTLVPVLIESPSQALTLIFF